MKFTNKNATPAYALIQAFYWITNCPIFFYASLYLQDKGLTNSQIGLVLAASYAAAAWLQPIVANLFQKSGVRLNVGMGYAYLLGSCMALALLLLPMGAIPMTVLLVAVLTLQSVMRPVLSSLPKDFEREGISINFGVARGVGSVAFSLASLLIGLLMRKMDPSRIPAIYLCTMLVLAALLFWFRAPGAPQPVQQEKAASGSNPIRSNPRFGLFLLGVICLLVPHVFIDSFMTQIMQSLGGNSANQGVALALATVLELPAMIFYSRISRRFGGSRLMLLAGWMWVVKDATALLATGPAGMYVSSVFQIATMGLFTPALVEYVAQVLPEKDFLKGQALAGSADSLGCLIATALGGRLIDMVGIKPSLGMMTAFALAGAILFTIAIPRKKEISR